MAGCVVVVGKMIIYDCYYEEKSSTVMQDIAMHLIGFILLRILVQ